MAERSKRSELTVGGVARSLLAGGIAGGLSRSAVAPLERLKILMQVQGNDMVYRGVMQGLVQMYKREGMQGMFKGNGTNCARIIPNSAVKFFCYEQLVRMITAWRERTTGEKALNPGLRLVAGATAGVIAMSATYPLDMVRGRLTVQESAEKQQYRGMWHATRTIAREEGLLTLYKGWLPSVIGVVPYVGLNFAVYETLKDVIIHSSDAHSERDLSVATRLGCGAVAGTLGQTVAYPFDVARRRLQVSGWKGAEHLVQGEAENHVYRGMVDCFVKTVRYEGVGALFKGLWPNYVKVVPSIAIAFVTYEHVKEMLGAEIKISD